MFLEAIDPAQFATVRLGGEDRRVKRARLGLHLQLSRLDDQFDKAMDAGELGGIVREYLRRCGLDASGSASELLNAYVTLRGLNTWNWLLAWQREPHQAREVPAYEYPGRVWAWWVHKLAWHYGWSRDAIFDLWPEEAAAYLQEIFIAEFDATEQRRSLSELSYKYDKQTQRSQFIPLAKPGWMVGREEPRRHRIHRRFVPVGHIIDLEEVAKTIH